MIRFVLRFVGLLCLALSFIFIVYDGTRSIANQRLNITTVAELWTGIHERSLIAIEPALRGIAQWLWDPLATGFLNAPTWLVLLVIGAILTVAGRKRRPLIGYAR